jgi:hypothetical protein
MEISSPETVDHVDTALSVPEPETETPSSKLQVDNEANTPHVTSPSAQPSTTQSHVPSQVDLTTVSSVAAVVVSTSNLLKQATSRLEAAFLSNLQPASNVSTVQGRATFSRLFLPPPPLPPPLLEQQGVPPQSVKQAHTEVASKGISQAPSKESLKESGCASPSLAQSKGSKASRSHKRISQTSSVSSMKKGDTSKSVKKDKDKQKESIKRDVEKYCTPGDYVLIVSDVTDPLPYPGSRLKPSFVQVKAIAHKRSRRETGPTLPTKEYSVPPSRLE